MSTRKKIAPSTPTPASATAARKRAHGRYAVADERKARALAEGHSASYYWPSNVEKRAAYEAKKAHNRAHHAICGDPKLAEETIRLMLDGHFDR
jgi:hypothetical protein